MAITEATHPAAAGPYVAAQLLRKKHTLTLTIQVRALHLAPDGNVTTSVRTRAGSGYLVHRRATADDSGAVSESASVDVPGGARTLRIVSTALATRRPLARNSSRWSHADSNRFYRPCPA